MEKPYVIFYCDDCELLTPAIAVFKKIHSDVNVHTASDIEELLSKVKENAPKLILVYFQDQDKSYVPMVKKLRENIDASSIPVLIYRELPAEEVLQDAFKKLGR